MKDRWLEDIHDKMAGLEAREPYELWQRIESGHLVVTPRRKGLFLTWRPWAAAAMLAVTAGLIWLFVDFSHDKTLGQTAADGIAQIENGEITDNGAELTPAQSSKAFQVAEIVNKSNDKDLEKGGITTASNDLYQRSNVDGASSDAGQDVVEMTNRPETGDCSVENTDQQLKAIQDKEPAEVTAESLGQLLHDVVDEPLFLSERNNGSRMALGVYTSGGMAGINVSRLSLSDDYATSIPNPEGNHFPADNNSPVELSKKSRKASTPSMKHNIPLRFGISLAYNVTPRVSVETGLSYSRLSSDVEYFYYSGNFYLNGELQLHYIGIPVNMKYRFASWRMLSFYGSAGFLTEKLVSGSMSGYTSYSSDRVSADVKEKPWQWSVNGAAGVQLNFTRQVGIYAEPGISYYFDNGSSVKNVYKDRNLSFTLNMGFRFTLGK